MNESAAKESASDPPLSLFKVGVVTADSKRQKTTWKLTLSMVSTVEI